MLREKVAEHLPTDCAAFVEPPWKMVPNKAILPILWEMCPYFR